MWRCTVGSPVRSRRGFDWFTLVVGIISLMVAGYTLGDGPNWWPDLDFRWVLATGAVLVGLTLLASSMRGGRGSDR